MLRLKDGSVYLFSGIWLLASACAALDTRHERLIHGHVFGPRSLFKLNGNSQSFRRVKPDENSSARRQPVKRPTDHLVSLADSEQLLDGQVGKKNQFWTDRRAIVGHPKSFETQTLGSLDALNPKRWSVKCSKMDQGMANIDQDQWYPKASQQSNRNEQQSEIFFNRNDQAKQGALVNQYLAPIDSRGSSSSSTANGHPHDGYYESVASSRYRILGWLNKPNNYIKLDNPEAAYSEHAARSGNFDYVNVVQHTADFSLDEPTKCSMDRSETIQPNFDEATNGRFVQYFHQDNSEPVVSARTKEPEDPWPPTVVSSFVAPWLDQRLTEKFLVYGQIPLEEEKAISKYSHAVGRTDKGIFRVEKPSAGVGELNEGLKAVDGERDEKVDEKLDLKSSTEYLDSNQTSSRQWEKNDSHQPSSAPKSAERPSNHKDGSSDSSEDGESLGMSELDSGHEEALAEIAASVEPPETRDEEEGSQDEHSDDTFSAYGMDEDAVMDNFLTDESSKKHEAAAAAGAGATEAKEGGNNEAKAIGRDGGKPGGNAEENEEEETAREEGKWEGPAEVDAAAERLNKPTDEDGEEAKLTLKWHRQPVRQQRSAEEDI